MHPARKRFPCRWIQNEKLEESTTSILPIIPFLSPDLSKYCQRIWKIFLLLMLRTIFKMDSMVWDIGIQDKIVYLIVAATATYLAFPLVSTAKGLFGKTEKAEAKFGCYEDACSSCQVVVDKKQSLRKTKRG